jgi:uncharacterized protein YqgQ
MGKNVFTEYLDIYHEYRVLVPLSEEAEERLYRGEIYDDGEISECFVKMVFNEEIFVYLEDRLFDILNVKFNLLINMYEEEILEREYITDAISITKKLINESDEEKFKLLATDFLNLLVIAEDNKRIVGFYF